MPGTLYLVATPIGNLSDLSARVKVTFEKVDLILAEDTRVTIKLLNHLGVKKRMMSCHEFNEKSRLKIITEFASLNQSVALVSDAGTPLVSDPGKAIVEQALACDMNIVPIAGPSASLLALIASGLPCDRFVFEGFLPIKQNMLKARLEKLRHEERTIILYESPHRLLKTLKTISEYFGDRDICLAREITKKHEEFIRGKISEVSNKLDQAKILGEYVIVLAGDKTSAEAASPDKIELENFIKDMLASGQTIKTIVHTMTETHKVKRSEIYQLALEIQKAYKVSADDLIN